MKPYFLGADNMPCIWPVPDDCVWNSERYKTGNDLKVAVEDDFLAEVSIFVGQLKDACNIDAILVNECADITVCRNGDTESAPQGYTLVVGRNGVLLTTSSANGVFYGCQTLLQLIVNCPDPSIHGVRIVDRPETVVRSVRLRLDGLSIALFKRLIDFLAKYKINRLCVDGSELDSSFAADEITELREYMQSRYIQLDVGLTGESGNYLNALLDALETSCRLWWRGYKPAQTIFGDAMPEYLGRVVAQLYPMERDRLLGRAMPSVNKWNYKALNLRAFYNSPLYRLSWRLDDYDYTFMTDSRNLANTVPFSLFQGITDMRLQSALVLAGNGRNRGVFGIPVSMALSSLVFLHSYIMDGKELNGAFAGHYRVRYRDGSNIQVKMTVGETICCRAAGHGGNDTADYANPVFTGITRFNRPYTVCAYEWVNPWPDKAVETIDILPAAGMEAGGIAVFGITAIL